MAKMRYAWLLLMFVFVLLCNIKSRKGEVGRMKSEQGKKAHKFSLCVFHSLAVYQACYSSNSILINCIRYKRKRKGEKEIYGKSILLFPISWNFFGALW